MYFAQADKPSTSPSVGVDADVDASTGDGDSGGFGVGDEIVWGLTYRMLELFFSAIDPEWTGHD